jgi:hypothetical protein
MSNRDEKKAKTAAKATPEKGAKAEKSSKGKDAKAADAAGGKRKLGLRGAAPWAARHAAKHAAEARARAAEPPPPGSARATIRSPAGAEELKAKIAEFHNLLQQVRAARKNLNKGFFEVGAVLREIQQRRLYEAKGFGSFENFLEREIDLGKTVSLKLVRIACLLQRDAALELGMDKAMAGITAFDVALDTAAGGPVAPQNIPSTPKVALPLKPPMGRVG